ncbi:MAG: DinB family protein [Actinomycetota bacterium]|nr:DinB family protein [Actinomycetota bacterium]
MNWIAPEIGRVDEPFTGDELSTLEGFLEWGRYTLLHKCAGLAADQLVLRPVPPSRLSLLGLIRHLTDVERSWFRRRFAAEDVPLLYSRPGMPDAAFEDVDPGGAETDYAALVSEWELSRLAICDRKLDETFAHPSYGPMSLRWILCHMCSEYDRHNGHADLLRESIDGRAGS